MIAEEVAIDRELHEIERDLHPHHIAVRFTGANTMNAVTLVTGQSTTATIVPLQADGITQTPDVTLSNQLFTITGPSVELTAGGDGTATIKGISPSTGAVQGTATATVTDKNGNVGTFTQAFTRDRRGTCQRRSGRHGPHHGNRRAVQSAR